MHFLDITNGIEIYWIENYGLVEISFDEKRKEKL